MFHNLLKGDDTSAMNCVTATQCCSVCEITDFLTRKVNFFTPQEVLKRLSKVVKIRCCLPFVHFWHLYWLSCFKLCKIWYGLWNFLKDLWDGKIWQLYFAISRSTSGLDSIVLHVTKSGSKISINYWSWKLISMSFWVFFHASRVQLFFNFFACQIFAEMAWLSHLLETL